MKSILTHLFDHHTLTREESKEVLLNIGKGGVYNNSQIAAFMTVFMMRSITVEELSGFREAMQELCLRVAFPGYDLMDLCGTGGDGKDTFNISTLTSFVVAASGISVAKHGNYGVSSSSGSSNMMEYFGHRFTHDPDELQRKLDTCNICFLHAPLFHPAMKWVGPIRKELGVRTFFNMLGPLVNPAFPQRQLSGVYSLDLARLYGYLFQQTDRDYAIVYSLDGYDEISLTGAFKLFEPSGERVLSPAHLGLPSYTQEAIFGGGSVEEAARIFEGVLKNEGTPAQRDVVLANACIAIHCARPQLSLEECLEQARESLFSGKAYRLFISFISQ